MRIKPKRKRFDPAAEAEDPDKSLREVLELLNGGTPEWLRETDAPQSEIEKVRTRQRSEVRQHLTEMVQGWLASGPVLSKWAEMKLSVGYPNLSGWEGASRVMFRPEGPRLRYFIKYAPRRRWSAWDHAVNQFLRLVTNPKCGQLGGPCERCGRYYIRAGRKPKRFCSKHCARTEGAKTAMQRKREKAREEKLEAVTKAMAEWESRSRRAEKWRGFVCRKCPGVTLTFLTRAIHKGEISEPKEKGQ